jgi:4,5-dihydroxyphthalate decarboxylase
VAKLNLTIAMGDYDRTRPLADGRVPIDGVAPRILLLSPEEMFFRAFRHADFDVCELSLSSFAVRTARDDNPYIGIPVFPSRAFRHTAIVVRTDRIKAAADLRGKRLGTPEYQLTACVWARALLQDEFGLAPHEVTWVRGGLEEPGRREKLDLDVPAQLRLESAPSGATLSAMLAAGELDGLVSPRLPSCFEDGHGALGWLFPDPMHAASEYYRRTRIFPIMHLIGLRRRLAERHPWLPATLLKAFTLAKALAVRELDDTSASKVTLPFIEEHLLGARRLLGADFWSYGLDEVNRNVLDTFLAHHHAQGLSARRLRAAELFHAAALEMFRI